MPCRAVPSFFRPLFDVERPGARVCLAADAKGMFGPMIYGGSVHASLSLGNSVSCAYASFASVCFRCRGVIQVALAAMEAHQRTSSVAGSGWPETVAAERMQLQQLRFGITHEGAIVVVQLNAGN